jgi:hypothetical protein
VNFDENIAYRKSIEDSMDSNDEEEHEDPKEESTVLQIILMKNQNDHLNLWNQLLFLG